MVTVKRNRGWTFILFVILMVFLSGCTGPTRAAISGAAFCDVSTAWVGPRTEAQVIADKAPYTTAFLLQHNLFGETTCGWKPPQQKKR